MTTTLRPAEPETRGAAGARTRRFTVCVNSRPVGGITLSNDGRHGPSVGVIGELAIDEPGRGRGRGAVAALAAEEVLRSWGCVHAAVSVPEDAGPARRLAASLGYAERSRHLVKQLDGPRAELPPGSAVRPLRPEESRPWLDSGRERFVAALTAVGVPHGHAETDSAATLAAMAPGGVPSPGTALLGVDHDGRTVGFLWLRTTDPAWVFSVEVDARHRGRGHGRTAMHAAENHCRDAGRATLGLNVFTLNTTARALYDSLGYRTVTRHFTKPLL